LLSRFKRSGEAAADFRTALPLLQRLHDDFAERPNYAYELANCFNSLAAVLWSTSESAEARQRCEQALGLQRQLVADFPKVPDYRSALAGSLDNLAFLLREQKPPQLAEARRLLQEAHPHHQEAIQTNPRHRTFSQRLRDHYAGLAEVLLRQKEPAAAAEAAAELVQVFPDDWQRYHRAASILARCMLQAEDPQRAQEFAARATEHLREAVQRGFAEPGLLNTPAFKALRQRNRDCDRMVQELEKKLPPQ
jgi:tetratricopeptide (TPR) repeat protein